MDSSPFDFTGRRVLVTGGSRGIGRAIVERFHRVGAEVFVLGKDKTRLLQLQADFPERVHILPVDLSHWEETRKVLESLPLIHHVVNNAGVPAPFPFLSIPPEEIDKILGVNVKALINVSQVTAGKMVQEKVDRATIVNISSIGDQVALTGLASLYSASKAAVTNLTKSMASELEKFGIRVNCVRPGVVATDLLSHYPPDVVQDLVPKYMERVIDGVQVKAEDVAESVLFLSSPASAAINGTAITIDAGFTTR